MSVDTAAEAEYRMNIYIGTQRAFGIESAEAAEAGERYRAAVRAHGDARREA